jgi:hypothetical protein
MNDSLEQAVARKKAFARALMGALKCDIPQPHPQPNLAIARVRSLNKLTEVGN